MEAMVLQPRTRMQVNLFRQIAKALSIPFSFMSTEEIAKGNTAFLAEIQTAGKQARKIAAGKAKGQTLDDLLNEPE